LDLKSLAECLTESAIPRCESMDIATDRQPFGLPSNDFLKDLAALLDSSFQFFGILVLD
jgi:hypothetical protein